MRLTRRILFPLTVGVVLAVVGFIACDGLPPPPAHPERGDAGYQCAVAAVPQGGIDRGVTCAPEGAPCRINNGPGTCRTTETVQDNPPAVVFSCVCMPVPAPQGGAATSGSTWALTGIDAGPPAPGQTLTIGAHLASTSVRATAVVNFGGGNGLPVPLSRPQGSLALTLTRRLLPEDENLCDLSLIGGDVLLPSVVLPIGTTGPSLVEFQAFSGVLDLQTSEIAIFACGTITNGLFPKGSSPIYFSSNVGGEFEPLSRNAILFSASTLTPHGTNGVFGIARHGSGGFRPAIGTMGGDPLLGNPNFAVTLGRAYGGTTAVLGIGLSNTSYSGVNLPLALPGIPSAWIFVSPDVVVTAVTSGSGPGMGSTSVALPIPNDPALLGLAVYFQWLVQDPPPGFDGLALSDALMIKIG